MPGIPLIPQPFERIVVGQRNYFLLDLYLKCQSGNILTRWRLQIPIGKRFYSADYLKLEFIRDAYDETKPYCLLCCNSLCNDSMRPAKLVRHLERVHAEHVEKQLKYFKRLNEEKSKCKQMSLDSMFKTETSLNECGFQPTKKSRLHTDGEELLKPAFEI